MCISRRYRMKVLHTQWVMTTRPALLGSKGVSTGAALRQRVQQCPGLLQVSGVKAFGEPAGDRSEQLACLHVLALVLPEATQTRGSAQLQRLGLLAARHRQGQTKTLLRFQHRLLSAPLQQEFAFASI